MDNTRFTDLTVANLTSLVGRQFEPAEWITIDQSRIDAFADCTDDHQFIHVDPVRVAKETAFPGTVAHGFLLLSLAAGHPQRNFPMVTNVALMLNYGIDKLRFINPVFAGQRVRYQSRVLAVEPRGEGRMLLRLQSTLHIEGQEKPALVAELLALYVARGS
jgi:acyl dehydratase